MSRQDDIRNLIRIQFRRLQLLEEQKASFGSLYSPVHILIEIEDIETEINKLQTELDEIETNPMMLKERIEQQHRRIAHGLAGIHEEVTKPIPIEKKHLRVIGRPPLVSRQA